MESTLTEEILTHVEDGVLVITMNRPEARNAMTQTMCEAISDQLDRLDAEAELRCAVLGGSGGTFCSGMDLKGFLKGERPSVPGRGFGALTEWSPKKPVIAAVDGHALAGGLELVLGCDMVVANSNAKFGIPEPKRGLVAAGGGVVRLPRRIPRAVAMELALTGDSITAQRAYELGLINAVVDGPAVEGALALARRVADCGPMAIIATKAVMRDSWFWPDNEINQHQRSYLLDVFNSEDAREGARAFAEKRKPNWQGK
jgi:enoyl-CoA hydratase